MVSYPRGVCRGQWRTGLIGEEGKCWARWLNRELEIEGVPVRLTISELHECIVILAELKTPGRKMGRRVATRVAGLILTALRLPRPDGGPSMTFDGLATDPVRDLDFGGLAEWYRGTGMRRAGLVVRSQDQGAGASALACLVISRIASWRSFVPIGWQPAISWPWITETSGSPAASSFSVGADPGWAGLGARPEAGI